MSHDVAQRRQELGVRMALGASPGSLVRGVVFSGLRLVAIGLAAGAAIALVAGRWVEGLLFQLSARDPLVFAVAVGVLLVVAVVAGLAPALAAARVDPNVVLRAD
jgi:ABC-type antimicrobial peptide transport system permease subunit